MMLSLLQLVVISSPVDRSDTGNHRKWHIFEPTYLKYAIHLKLANHSSRSLQLHWRPHRSNQKKGCRKEKNKKIKIEKGGRIYTYDAFKITF